MTISERLGIGQFIKDPLSAARGVLLRFPVSVLTFMLLAAAVNWKVYDPTAIDRSFDIQTGLLSAALASLGACVAAEARHVAWPIRQVAALGAALLFFSLVWFDRLVGTLPLGILAVSVAFVFLGPFLRSATPLAFWSYGRRLALEALIAMLVTITVATGFIAVIAATSYLFDLELPRRTYAHVWSTAATFVAPLFALARFPNSFDEIPEEMLAESRLYSALRALADFVAAPVFIALVVIFHFYALKILVGGQLPKGQIGWIVVSFGVGMLALLLAFEPFRPVARAPLRIFLRYWPLTIPVPVILLGLALAERVEQYGVTPDRYLLGAFAIALAVLAIMQAFPIMRRDGRILIAIPMIVLLVASVGPWGAINVSIDRQIERFKTLVSSTKRSLKQQSEAKSALRFLASHGAISKVSPSELVIEDSRKRSEWNDAIARVEEHFHLGNVRVTATRDRFSASFKQIVVDPDGFDMIVPVLTLVDRADQATTVPYDGGELRIALDDFEVMIAVKSGPSARFVIPKDEFERAMLASVDNAQVLELGNNDRRLKLVVMSAAGKLVPQLELDRMSATLLLRTGDWQ